MNKTILIVEDEFSLQKLYEQSFKDEGYKVLIAKNGAEALELAECLLHRTLI